MSSVPGALYTYASERVELPEMADVSADMLVSTTGITEDLYESAVYYIPIESVDPYLEFPGVYFNYTADSNRWPLRSLGVKDEDLLKFNLDIFLFDSNNYYILKIAGHRKELKGSISMA